MLEFSAVDLGTLVEALEDHATEHSWWFDPRTGRLLLTTDDADDADVVPSDELIPVEPTPARLAKHDMEDFLDQVRDPRPRRLLERSLSDGRRFREALSEFPALREAWFRFVEVRQERRAVQWLADEGVIAAAVARRELARRPDPDRHDARGSADGHEIARQVGDDLRPIYGERLREVVLVGSRARGEGHPESDVDLLVVLDHVESVWDELALMDYVLWGHSYNNDVVVTAIPVAEHDLRQFKLPAMVRARDAGGAPGTDHDAGPRSGSGPGADSDADERFGLPRSHEELEAACLLAKHGHGRAAVSRAYLGALFAAEDALLALGVSRVKHARVVAMFGKLVVRDGGMDPEVGRLLRSLYERRDAVDEARVAVPEYEAHRAVEDAEHVVRAVASWLARR